jgi:hypothetical protein
VSAGGGRFPAPPRCGAGFHLVRGSAADRWTY